MSLKVESVVKRFPSAALGLIFLVQGAWATAITNTGVVVSTMSATGGASLSYCPDCFSGRRNEARDSLGNLYLAHLELYKGKRRVFLARSTDNGATWANTTATPIETAGDVPSPNSYNQNGDVSLAIDSHDVLHLVWGGTNRTLDMVGDVEAKCVYMSAPVPGTVWSPYVKIAANAYEGWEYGFRIAVDGKDGVHITWQGQDSPSQYTVRYASRSAASPQWTPTVEVNLDGNSEYAPEIVIDADNAVHLVASQAAGLTGPGYAVVYASRSFAGRWSSPWTTVFKSYPYAISGPALTIASSGTLFAAWSSPDGTYANPQARFATLAPGGSWSSPAAIQPIAGSTEYSVNLAADNANKVYAVWASADASGSNLNIKQSIYAAGAWQPWSNVSSGGTNTQFLPSLRWSNWHNNGGNLEIAWADYDNVSPATATLRVLQNPAVAMGKSPVPAVDNQIKPLAIVSPRDGETWMAGSTQQIKWTGGNPAWSTVNISMISGDGGQVVEGIAGNLPNNGTYAWTVNLPAGAYLAYVEGDRGQPDQNWTYGQPFLIVNSSSPASIVTIGSPANRASVSKGVTLTAAVTGNIGSIAYVLDGSSLGAPLSTPPYTFSWDSTQVSNGTHTLVAEGLDKNTGQWSVRSSSITVTVNNAVKPSVTILTPAAGAILSSSVTITAAVTGNVGAVAYTLDGHGYLTNAIVTPPYSFVWDTTQVSAGTHSLTAGIWDAGTRAYLGGSAPIAVTIKQAPPVTVPLVITSPTGAENWAVGSTHQITWTGGNPAWPMLIQVIDSAKWQVVKTLADNAPNNGTFSWTVDMASGTYQIYVQGDRGQPDSNWTYSHPFSVSSAPLVTAPLVITSPSGAENCSVGSTHQITWTGGNPAWPMLIQVIDSAKWQVVKTLTDNAKNNGTFPWTVDMASGTYQIYVQGDRGQPDSNWTYSHPFSVSSAPLMTAPLVITSPSGAENWSVGSTHQITWTGGNPAWPMLIQVIDSAKWQVAKTLADNAPNNGTFSWTVDMASGTYQIYVQGDRGQPDSNWVYGQPFTVQAATLPVVLMSGSARAVIKVPYDGKRVKGNSLTIMASLIVGSPSETSQILFELRAAGATTWAPVSASNINHPNPAASFPYLIQCDTTLLAPGSYELRAVASDKAGIKDAVPAAITVVIAAKDDANFDINENVDSADGKVSKQQAVDNAASNSIQASGSSGKDSVADVTLPAGALNSSSATITAVCNPAITTPTPSGLTLMGSAVQLNLSNGQSALNAPASVTLSYPEDADPASLRIISLKEGTDHWAQDIVSTVNAASHTITGQTMHFSIFAVISVGPAADDLSRIRIYPNPYRPNGGNPDQGKPFSAGDITSGITFDNLPAIVTIKIYTLSGRQVAKFDAGNSNGALQWDAKNTDGREAASGGYFAVISSPGLSPVVKRFLIIR